MKKICSVVLVVALSFFALSASAQGGGQKGQMKEAMRQRLKDSLNLSDVMIDSVVAIRQEMQPKMRAVMTDQSLQEGDKRTRMEAMKKEMYERLKNAGLTAEQVKKMKEMDERMREQMKERKPAN
ncbi:hypothetical protein I5907_20835 [Panacibacter sp. DH6]|uniref:Periplasmic heavy metal sensor n=1 Tax=Panacibacter microcysteis TaxID=2793269 RepID=A0A931H0E8_9BACT|nr:hypothetical protein [Panacibacter microcysteis]MBG9378691.1 hypothetical protein [Panacibacter microcysteis]